MDQPGKRLLLHPDRHGPGIETAPGDLTGVELKGRPLMHL
jgi:hypothetical protein